MKKLIFGLFLALFATTFVACDDLFDDDDDDNLTGIDLKDRSFRCDDDIDDNDRHKPINTDDLPGYVRNHLDKNFPGVKIGVAFIDDDEDDIDVYILQGERWRELEFDDDKFGGFEDEGKSVGNLSKSVTDCIENRFKGAKIQLAYLEDDDDLVVYILHNNRIIELDFED